MNIFVVLAESFVLILTLISYAVLADSYMIRIIFYIKTASLTTISSFHNFSQQTSGFLLAIGSSTPEFTTNLISTLGGKEDISLGVGAIAGSGSFGKF